MARSYLMAYRKTLNVWMSHGDEAVELPAGFQLTASSSNAMAAIENPEGKMWAVQFHPEVHHTQHGTDILRNFVLRICGAKPTWTPQHFIDATIASVRKTVGNGRAICALSGRRRLCRGGDASGSRHAGR